MQLSPAFIFITAKNLQSSKTLHIHSVVNRTGTVITFFKFYLDNFDEPVTRIYSEENIDSDQISKKHLFNRSYYI